VSPSGSHAELDTQLELAMRLEYVSPEELRPTLEQLNRTGRMLNRLLASLERR
jgi:four helix bundle protein